VNYAIQKRVLKWYLEKINARFIKIFFPIYNALYFTYHYSHLFFGIGIVFLILVFFFESNLLILDPNVGFDFFLFLGNIKALSTIVTSLEYASALFLSWVLKLLAVITMSPSELTLVPPIANNLAFAESLSNVVLIMLNRSWTAVETLLTF